MEDKIKELEMKLGIFAEDNKDILALLNYIVRIEERLDLAINQISNFGIQRDLAADLMDKDDFVDWGIDIEKIFKENEVEKTAELVEELEDEWDESH